MSKSNRYILWMAWRAVRSKKRRSRKTLSFMTVMSICGVALGVAALVIVLSVMGGFERDLKSKMFRGLPHLEILGKHATHGFALTDFPLSFFEETFPEVQRVEPFVQSDVVLKQRKHLASVTVIGIDPEKGGKLWGFADGMIEGNIQELSILHAPLSASWSDEDVDEKLPGVVLGESLAIQLNANLGDEVSILSPDAMSSGGARRVATRYVVIGLFRTDLVRFDSQYAVVSLREGRKYMPEYDVSLQQDEYVTGVAMNLGDPETVDGYVQRLKSLDKGLQSLTWKDTNKSLLFALKLEKFTMGAILLLIVLVAAFSISGTMMMTVYHKRSQVALLRSLGMNQKDIGKLFLAQGFTIGSVGIFWGLLVGLGACTLLYYFQFIDLPEGVYYQKKLPVRFLPVEYTVICFSAWVLSILAATWPAMTAAKQDPANGLRFS